VFHALLQLIAVRKKFLEQNFWSTIARRLYQMNI
jgi:hypothetical protein